MYRDRDEIKRNLQDFFTSLVALANEDDVITEEEQNVLDKIKEGIDDLEEQLFQVLESNLSIAEIKDIERQILQDIVHNTMNVIEEDGVVSKDESVLLTQLEKFAETGVINNE